MSEQPSAQAVQQVTEAQLYEILGRVYVSWQVASKERAAFAYAAQQNYQAAQKAQRERDEARAELAREKSHGVELSKACE